MNVTCGECVQEHQFTDRKRTAAGVIHVVMVIMMAVVVVVVMQK
jgi:hypothetical protein